MNLFDLLFGKAISRRITDYQNDFITKHVIEVENIYQQMRGWRHDYHNHIQVLKAYRAMSKDDMIDDYLNSIETDLTNVDTLIKSGNVMVDAILNSKLSLAVVKKISVKSKAIVPKNLTISEIDLCIIIGNLLDNAIEAVLRIDDINKRFIRVYIDLKKNNLYISITNSSCNITKFGGKYISTKGHNHGFGLIRVDRIVDKYAGYIKRNNEDTAFTCEIMLPL